MELQSDEDSLDYVENAALLLNKPEELAGKFMYEEWMQKTCSSSTSLKNSKQKKLGGSCPESDPLLSEAQLIDGTTILDEFDIRIPQPQYVSKEPIHTKSLRAILRMGTSDRNEGKRNLVDETYESEKRFKPVDSDDSDSDLFDNHIRLNRKWKPKDSSLTILKSFENQPSTSGNTCKENDIDNEGITKCEIILMRPPVTVEMNFIDDTMCLTFKDVEGLPIFIPQYMKLPENYSHLENADRLQVHAIQSVTHVQICKMLEYTLPQIVTKLGAKVHLCPLKCTKAFLHVGDAKLHALKHMNLKPFKCDWPNCRWEFYTAGRLARHRETHRRAMHFVCGSCNRSFSTIYNLHEHQKKHNKPATLPCHVKDCNAMFQNEKQRRDHFKTHDSSEAPFHCTNNRCTKKFFTQALVDAHLRYCKAVNDLTCHYNNCGRVFPNPYRLREHMRSHTGEKPYKCPYENCPWAFFTASKLRRHECSHTRDRKFHCTIGDCKKSFLRSEHLKDHTLTHIEKQMLEGDGRCASSVTTKKNDFEKKPECTQVQPEEEDFATSSTSADALLEQAIQSLGVPSDMGATTSAPQESTSSAENENFSTVNLRDLD